MIRVIGRFGVPCKLCGRLTSPYRNLPQDSLLIPPRRLPLAQRDLQFILRPSFNPSRQYTVLTKTRCTSLSLQKKVGHQRMFVTQVGRFVLQVLRRRFILVGASAGGAVGAKLTYESWRKKWEDFKSNLPTLPSFEVPETNWRDFLPDLRETNWSDFLPSADIDLSQYSDYAKNSVHQGKEALSDYLDYMLKAEAVPKVMSATSIEEEKTKPTAESKTQAKRNVAAEKLQERLERSQEELIDMQQRYQREIEKLERDNRELRKQVIILKGDTLNSPRKVKKSLIDMYSDVLDLLAEYDAKYNITDHLPRVVVVGDQSAGKTSVLEMIAQARIFPRGAGQMMTRAPVMVTLSEGPSHVAQFKGSSNTYDLTQESELKALRQEVEIRMRNSVKEGQTVSQEVISMNVKGPGLQRMVLVDLPGIIGTVTSGMSTDTKQSITGMSKQYMSNPNAIILCIQDGSIDAERSNVTDLVQSMDPQGKRTIFVLTKVDLAEQNETSPSRLKNILEGKVFPMKALGYFAVITGTGNTNESIDAIRNYEEDFFRNSKLFKSGVFKASQMTTQNMSFAVSKCFWKMVRESIEQQADAYKAKRFNLETEWKNHFPRLRELDRNELFDKGRGEILDEVLSLGEITPQQWEDALWQNLWSQVNSHVIENIYLPAAQAGNPGNFNTTVDIQLKQWAERTLPEMSVKVGRDTLFKEFSKAMEFNKENNRKDGSSLFDQLKESVIDECLKSHRWQSKAVDSLRVIQLTALEDWSVTDKQQWDAAELFLEDTLHVLSEKASDDLYNLIGPGQTERWMYWKYRTAEQSLRSSIRDELQKLFHMNEHHAQTLMEDEITTVRKNLETINVQADKDAILDTWNHMYREHFLHQAITSAQECKKGFHHRNLVKSQLECNDVVLFWRIQKMLQSTSNALRQQIMNHEARRLEKEVKQVLEEMGHDEAQKQKLITGRQVELAEEVKRVRHIQESLDSFIDSLKEEK